MLQRAALLVVVLAVLSIAAVAAAADVQGTIKSVDPSGRVVTLEDGTQLMIPATTKVDRDALKPGAQVKASFEAKGTSKVVTSIQVQPPQ